MAILFLRDGLNACSNRTENAVEKVQCQLCTPDGLHKLIEKEVVDSYKNTYREKHRAQERANCNITTRHNGATHKIFTHQQYCWGHDRMAEVRARKY